jgi:hypothetical protein
MQRFRELWGVVFRKQSKGEGTLLQQLAKLRQQDRLYCRTRIARRCQSAKPTVSLNKLCEVESVEKWMRKKGQASELRAIRSEKKKVKN